MNTPTPPDQLVLEVVFTDKVGNLAKNCTGLEAKLQAHERAFFAVNNRSMPGRKSLALYYEHFRIDVSATTTMAMEDLYSLKFKEWGDKY